ncbi:MAG: signal peptidase II [Chromatiales bacterium]
MVQWLWLSASVVAVDQVTKYLVSAHFELHESREILPFFNLTLVHNMGAAFSMLHDAGGWQRWGLSVLAVAVSVAIIYWLPRLRTQSWRLPLALALILGGTLGNLCDRLALGYVVDFLDFYLGNSHWPAFNVADSAITVGAVILILDTLSRQPPDAGEHS